MREIIICNIIMLLIFLCPWLEKKPLVDALFIIAIIVVDVCYAFYAIKARQKNKNASSEDEQE